MIFIPVVAVLAACWHSFMLLHQQWTDWADTSHTHGYLIAAICVWLLWRSRPAAESVAKPFSWWRIWPLVLAMTGWLFVVMAGIQALELVLVPLVLWCAIGAGFGWHAARSAAFPAGYFLFATPIWGAANGLFQWSSVYAVRAALRVVGVPAYFDENRVHIPEGTFEIAGGCSGLHFVVVAAAMAALLGELRRDGLVGRMKLLLLAVGLAMLANWLRITIIVEAGHLTNMQHYLVTRSHYGFGWVVFAVCMAVFFWVESRMPRSKTVAPEQERVTPRWQGVTIAVVPVMAFFVLWHALAARPATATLEEPQTNTSWSIVGDATFSWQPMLAGVDEADLRHYRRTDGAAIDAYSGLYLYQVQGKEFSAYGNDLHPGARLLDQEAQVIAGTPFVLQRFRNNAGGEDLVAATYSVGQKSFAQPAMAQVWYALSAMLQLRSPASQVLLLHTACQPDCAAALNLLRDWKEGS